LRVPQIAFLILTIFVLRRARDLKLQKHRSLARHPGAMQPEILLASTLASVLL
jgi:hypothetical protein